MTKTLSLAAALACAVTAAQAEPLCIGTIDVHAGDPYGYVEGTNPTEHPEDGCKFRLGTSIARKILKACPVGTGCTIDAGQSIMGQTLRPYPQRLDGTQHYEPPTIKQVLGVWGTGEMLPEGIRGAWCEVPDDYGWLALDKLEDGEKCSSAVLHHEITANELIPHEELCKIKAVKPLIESKPPGPEDRQRMPRLRVTMRCIGLEGERPITTTGIWVIGVRSLYIKEISRKEHRR
jgi:hypothetical protein